MNEEKKGWKLKKKRNNKNEWKKKWQPKLKFADQNFHNQEPRKPAIYNRTSAKHDIWAQASMSLSLFFVISTFNHVLSRHDLHPFFKRQNFDIERFKELQCKCKTPLHASTVLKNRIGVELDLEDALHRD